MKKIWEKAQSIEPKVRPTSSTETFAQSTINAVGSKRYADSISNTQLPITSGFGQAKFYSDSMKKPVMAESSWSALNPAIKPASVPVKLQGVSTNYRFFSSMASESSSSKLSQEYFDYLRSAQISVPVLLPSNNVPMGFLQQKHFEGAVAGAFITCLKQGMVQPEVFICSVFQYGSPGSNATLLQMLAGIKLVRKNMNMLAYFPATPETPEEITTKLSNLRAKEFMFFYECLTRHRINQDLQVKLELYQQNTPLKDSLTVQNLTGNPCPDFIRKFDPPLGTITQEAYDQKSYASALQDCNHIRPVSGDLHVKTSDARDQLESWVITWINANNDKPNIQAILLLDSLRKLKLANPVNSNAALYASSYNQLRNLHGEFLIQNRIPMNLVTEVSLQQLPVTAEISRSYREIFLKLYYSKESPWLAFANTQVQKSNSKIINYDAIIKAFAEHLAKELTE